ncbi:hypothetical protein EV191_106219 [Tamaricihabitans halophyticus]|uniref:Uncharacterized protein n=1 Tax=Tamaricihabitans halophyticus TaxID=1262583 RepID=A0A4R2QY28_9PSEU|nr:hypothetical protein EV191_106219 [Tamaricihabitans halophyticus]
MGCEAVADRIAMLYGTRVKYLQPTGTGSVVLLPIRVSIHNRTVNNGVLSGGLEGE